LIRHGRHAAALYAAPGVAVAAWPHDSQSLASAADIIADFAISASVAVAFFAEFIIFIDSCMQFI